MKRVDWIITYNKWVKYEELCDGRLSSTVLWEESVKVPLLTWPDKIEKEELVYPVLTKIRKKIKIWIMKIGILTQPLRGNYGGVYRIGPCSRSWFGWGM